tara:strand:- start:2097 stop:2465 length:369 start_codon:yes stop_codon:yes gene_type:complete
MAHNINNLSWPPIKAWTSKKRIFGFRHFVAINYGGKPQNYWVNLVSVLDGEARLTADWLDLQDSLKWTPGWIELSRAESLPKYDCINKSYESKEIKPCLHLSDDSGLIIPTSSDFIRNWFIE